MNFILSFKASSAKIVNTDTLSSAFTSLRTRAIWGHVHAGASRMWRSNTGTRSATFWNFGFCPLHSSGENSDPTFCWKFVGTRIHFSLKCYVCWIKLFFVLGKLQSPTLEIWFLTGFSYLQNFTTVVFRKSIKEFSTHHYVQIPKEVVRNPNNDVQTPITAFRFTKLSKYRKQIFKNPNIRFRCFQIQTFYSVAYRYFF